jgi:hypothetical protein
LVVDKGAKDFSNRPKGKSVQDLVYHFGALCVFNKMVGVDPFFVWASLLYIHKSVGGIPSGDKGGPFERDAMEPEAVVDNGPFSHLDRQRCDDSEMKLRRRNSFEIGGV